MSSPPTLTLRINGEQHSVPAPITVDALLSHLAVDDRQVAVERNRSIVPKAEFATTELAQGDELEIVTFVGGG
jgi:thiamine biosynthesis protein ThiS